MGAAPITAGFLLTSLTVVAVIDLLMAQLGAWLQLSRLWVLCIARLAQLAAVLTTAACIPGAWRSLGLERGTVAAGLKKGLVWSAGFALITGLLFGCLFIAGQNPFRLIRTPLPSSPAGQVLFFWVGGVVAPVTEEVVFRGLIFGYLKRWGLVAALLVSTALFAVLHLPALPVTQIIGGMVFAVAYHMEGSLMVPIVIHGLGNLAIFTLSLPVFGALG